MGESIKHPILETVYNIKDLEIGKCISAMCYKGGLYEAPVIYNLGNATLTPDTIILENNIRDHKSFFFIMIGYDNHGNKLLLADRSLSKNCMMNLYYSERLLNYRPLEFADMELASIINNENNPNEIVPISSKELDSRYTFKNTLYRTYNNQFISTDTNNAWVGYLYKNPIKINGFFLDIQYKSSYQAHRQYIIQGSRTIDQEDWEDIDYFYKDYLGTYKDNALHPMGRSFYKRFNNNKRYLRYRVLCVSFSDTTNINNLVFYKEREFENDVSKYNLYQNIPSYGIVNNLKNIKFEGISNDIDINTSIWNFGAYYMLSDRQYQYPYFLYHYNNNTFNYFSFDNESYGYRPLLTAISKKEKDNFIKKYYISNTNLNESDDNTTIKLSLNEDYEFPVDVRVLINGEIVDRYNLSTSNPQITLTISKEDFTLKENFIKVLIITQETKYHRSFNYKVSINDKTNNIVKKDFIYNEIYKESNIKNDNNKGLYTEKDKASKSIKVDTIDKSSIDHIIITKNDINNNIKKLQILETNEDDYKNTKTTIFSNPKNIDIKKININFNQGEGE